MLVEKTKYAAGMWFKTDGRSAHLQICPLSNSEKLLKWKWRGKCHANTFIIFLQYHKILFYSFVNYALGQNLQCYEQYCQT